MARVRIGPRNLRAVSDRSADEVGSRGCMGAPHPKRGGIVSAGLGDARNFAPVARMRVLRLSRAGSCSCPAMRRLLRDAAKSASVRSAYSFSQHADS